MTVEKIQQLTLANWTKYRNFILYAVIGVSGVTLDFIIFYLLFNFGGWEKNLASTVSISCGIINNFVWNTIFNFKTKDRLLLRFVSFYSVGMVGIAITTVIFYLFVDKLGLNANFVKIISIFFVVVTQYSLNKRISFGSFR